MKIEFTHDILAKEIYKKASAEDKMRTKIRDFIANRYAYYKDAKALLDQDALDYINPYLSTITLKTEVHEFIAASRRLAKRKQFTLAAVVILTIAALIFSAINIQMDNYSIIAEISDVNNKIRSLSQKNRETQAVVAKVDRILAEDSPSLDTVTMDKAMLQEMIIKYNLLGKKQDTIRQQRDLAQSATLSDLAKEAKKDDEKYAFSLAVKSWELNKNNQQALRVMEQYTASEIPLSELPEQHIKSIVDKKSDRDNVKKLNDKDLKTIFSEENAVVTEQKKGVKRQLDIHLKDVRYDIKKQVEKPVILQTIQQQTNDVIEEKIKPNINIEKPILIQKKRINPKELPPSVINRVTINCATVNDNLNKWLTIDDARFYSLLVQYTSAKQIYFKVERTEKFIPPLFSEVTFYFKDGNSRVFLLTKEEVRGDSFYKLKLQSTDIAFLKEHDIEGLAFASKNKTVPHKLVLSPANQLTLTQLNKCAL